MLTPAEIAELIVDTGEKVDPGTWTLVAGSREDRHVYSIGGRRYAKVFAPSHRKVFERERTGLTLAAAEGLSAPKICRAEDLGTSGSVIVTAAAAGESLSSMLPAIDEETYEAVAGAIGGWIGSCHKLHVDRTDATKRPGHMDVRRADLEGINESIGVLRQGDLLPSRCAVSLVDFFGDAHRRCFSSQWVVAHSDIHSDHTFITRQVDGEYSCTMIDFESLAKSHQELDFVSPFLYILGQCFPGEQFGHDETPFAEHNAVKAFVRAYNTNVPADVDWLVVGCHAMAWCLSVARGCYEGRLNHGPQGPSSAVRLALQAGVALAVLPTDALSGAGT